MNFAAQTGSDGEAESPLGVAEMYELAGSTQSESRSRLFPNDGYIYLAWGLAWLVAYLSQWSTTEDGPFPEAGTTGGVLFGASLAAAGLFTVVHIARRVRGVGGASARAGQRWGISWLVAFSALPFLVGGVERAGAPPESVELLSSTLPVFIVGMLYVAGAAIADETLMFGAGIWIIAIAALATMVGVYDHHLVLAIGGGGGLLVTAALARRRRAELS